MFSEGGISEFEYHKIKREFPSNDENSICITGMAAALSGKKQESLTLFDSLPSDKTYRAHMSYGSTMFYLHENVRLLNHGLSCPEHFNDLFLTWMSAYNYYIIGDINKSSLMLRKYIQMMNDEEKIKQAEYAMSFHLEQLSKAYDVGATTPERFKESMYLAFSVLDEFNVGYRYVDVRLFPDQTAGCFIEVKSTDPDLVAKMELHLIRKQIAQNYSIDYDLEPQFTIGRKIPWEYNHARK